MANDFVGPGDFTGIGFDVPGSSVGDSARTKAWIAPDNDAPAGCGRIMLTRSGEAASETDAAATLPQKFGFLSKIFGVLSPDSPKVAGNIAVKAKLAANDNSFWVGDERDEGGGGVFGSDVDAATLTDGSSVVAWIGADRIVHAKYYPADEAHGGDPETTVARAEHTDEINALLSDLGSAGQRAGNADGRVKVAAYGQGGVAALWIADFGFTAALMGKLYMLEQGSTDGTAGESDAAPTALWTGRDIPAVSVPRFASNITVNVSEDGQVSVSYQSEPGYAGSALSVLIDTQFASGEASEDDMRGSNGGDLLAPSADVIDHQMLHGSSSPVKAVNTGSAEDVSKVEAEGGETESNPSSVLDDVSDAGLLPHGLAVDSPEVIIDVAATPVTVAGSGDGTPQNKPQVVVTTGGNPISLYLESGVAPGTAVIKLTPLSSDGHAITNANGGPVVTIVSDHAVVADVEKPYLELDPSLAAVGNGVGVAFVTESGDGSQSVYQLNVQIFDGQGSAISDTPAVVALASDHDTTYSDFNVGGHRGGNGHSENDEAQGSQDVPGSTGAGDVAGGSAQVAVVWVENADASGYGSIMGQRFGVVARDDNIQGNSDSGDNSGPGNSDDNVGDGDGGLVLVALGRDGSASSSDGESDAPFQLQSDTAESVIGRAPQVSGCGENGIAVAWVQESSPGSGVEVVAGEVLQTHGGTSILAINLTGLISNGIVHGTEPSLLSDASGDIVIGWIQAGDSGQYEAAVAVYRALETGGWTVPEAALVLRTFTSEPSNLDFGLQGGDDPTILLSWSSSGSRVSGARFDLDGNQEGSVFRIYGGDEGDGVSDGDMSVAGLSDGQIIVLYTQADGGDTSIGAMVVQTAPVNGNDESDNSGSGTGSSDYNLDNGTSQTAFIVTTPTEPEISLASTSPDATTSLVVVDLDSDLIRVFSSVESFSSTLGDSNGGSGSSNSGSGSDGDSDSSNSGSGGYDNALSDDDDHGDDGDSGSSGSGSSGSGKDGDDDNLAFVVGYGNDVKDYYDDDHEFEADEPVADIFDALQFANAFSENGNGEVIVFEASNLVVIRDFETL